MEDWDFTSNSDSFGDFESFMDGMDIDQDLENQAEFHSILNGSLEDTLVPIEEPEAKGPVSDFIDPMMLSKEAPSSKESSIYKAHAKSSIFMKRGRVSKPQHQRARSTPNTTATSFSFADINEPSEPSVGTLESILQDFNDEFLNDTDGLNLNTQSTVVLAVDSYASATEDCSNDQEYFEFFPDPVVPPIEPIELHIPDNSFEFDATLEDLFNEGDLASVEPSMLVSNAFFDSNPLVPACDVNFSLKSVDIQVKEEPKPQSTSKPESSSKIPSVWPQLKSVLVSPSFSGRLTPEILKYSATEASYQRLMSIIMRCVDRGYYDNSKPSRSKKPEGIKGKGTTEPPRFSDEPYFNSFCILPDNCAIYDFNKAAMKANIRPPVNTIRRPIARILYSRNKAFAEKYSTEQFPILPYEDKDSIYCPQYYRVEVKILTDSHGNSHSTPLNDTREGLCPFCPGIVFHSIKNSAYGQHLSLRHGVGTDGYLYPDPIAYGNYKKAKEGNKNRTTMSHVKDIKGVVCPVCYKIIEVEQSKASKDDQPLQYYLSHFKIEHRSPKSDSNYDKKTRMFVDASPYRNFSGISVTDYKTDVQGSREALLSLESELMAWFRKLSRQNFQRSLQ